MIIMINPEYYRDYYKAYKDCFHLVWSVILLYFILFLDGAKSLDGIEDKIMNIGKPFIFRRKHGNYLANKDAEGPLKVREEQHSTPVSENFTPRFGEICHSYPIRSHRIQSLGVLLYYFVLFLFLFFRLTFAVRRKNIFSEAKFHYESET